MKNTYQMMKAHVTLPPAGETISDLAGNTRKYGGEHNVHIAAVDQNRTAQGIYYFDEPILLRDLKIQGFSSTTWVVSEKIMVPDGYRIIAMLVDEKGIPLSNETLPLELEELPRTGWHLNKSGVLNAADEHDPVSLKSCADKFQGNSLPFGGFLRASMNSAKNAADTSTTKCRLSEDMIEAVLDAVRNSDLFQSLQTGPGGQATFTIDLQQTMCEVATDAIRNALKPGGLIWNNLRGS
ncbi:hypothetical protein [Atlantibacter subterraneus]|uniref:hypothetical protein n=1 Tax=Atlantibacter subterraneus TaxID=255519 RepID=UPI00289E7AE7|nr:hypothetical protein [Atlantibacter subterranea]